MDFAKARQIMVDSQIRPNDVTDPPLVSALLKVAREAFVPSSKKAVAYSELEIETSPGRFLWTPRDISKMIKAVDPHASDIALIIGVGAGYEAAILGELVETVIGLDEDERLIAETSDRLATLGADHVVTVAGTLAGGLADQGPYDIILVNGMVETVPDAWLDQLADGGRLGVVVEERAGLGRARVYTQAGGVVSHRTVFDAAPPKFDAFDRERGFAF